MKTDHLRIRLNATDKARITIAAELEARTISEVVICGAMKEVERIEKRKQVQRKEKS